MNCEVQGTFTSEKIRCVRWIPEQLSSISARHFLTASWDEKLNSLRLWRIEDTDDPNTSIDTLASLNASPGADWTSLQYVGSVRETRYAAATSDGDAMLLSPITDSTTPSIDTLLTWKGLHSFE